MDASIKNALKRKRKKRCDLFTDKKKRSKSSIKSNSNELEGTIEGSLNLTPIYPAQKNPKFFTSTPAVKKSIRRIVSVTSISGIASPLPVLEVGPSSTQCCVNVLYT